MASTIELASEVTARSRLQCWGDFAIADAATGADLKPRGRKTRALLAYLALHPGKAVSRERLSGLLWGGRGEEQARASLRQALVELKPLSNGTRNALTVERGQVMLNPAGFFTDLDEMRAAVARGDYGALLTALPENDDRLFANLDDIDEGFDDWLAIERTRQRDALAGLVAEAAAAAVADGEAAAARALSARHREFEPGAASSTLFATSASAAPAVGISALRTGVGMRPARWPVAALFALLLVAAVAAITAWQRPVPSAEAPPTIAVLPFTNLSAPGDGAFAEGLSEEVLAQLAREPGLRVAGRTSSWQFRNRTADLDEVGRKLGVRFILEGTVRSAGDRIRVNVALAQASDGLQLWADTFDGTIDDVFAIQHEIGGKVAGALGRKLTQARPGAPATSGAVYSRYLTARSLIRERNPRAMIAAREQLEEALALDPGFAPAWSSMAQVKRWEGNGPGAAGQRAREDALAHARRALALAPDLAQAHGVLGMILGYEDPVGQQHIKRAAALDPNNAEFQFWLGHVYTNEPNYPAMLTAYRRAFALDPLWSHAQDYAVLAAWQLERRDEAIGYVRRVEREGSRHDAHMLRGLLAVYSGDLSEAALQFGAARAATGDPGKQAIAAYKRAGILFQLGMIDAAREEWASCRRIWAQGEKQPLEIPHRYAAHLALKQGKLPAAAELASAARSGDPVANDLVAAMARRLIRAGRAREVVALYDSQPGLLGISAARPRSQWFDTAVYSAPVIASALRAVDRGAEADRMLGHADRMIADALRRSGGRAPASFYAVAAQTWALLGRHEAALTGLERARRNGWINANFNAGDLVDDIGDDPAFAGLRGDARFEAIRTRMNAHLAREQRELSAATAL